MAIAVVVHRPLARVPENAMKFVVGMMLTGFGTFWSGEGIGIAWPGDDLAILALPGRLPGPGPGRRLAGPARWRRRPAGPSLAHRPRAGRPAMIRFARAFLHFWSDFLIGDRLGAVHRPDRRPRSAPGSWSGWACRAAWSASCSSWRSPLIGAFSIGLATRR